MRNRNCAILGILSLSFVIGSSTVAGDSPNLYRNKTHAFSILFPTEWQQRNGQTPSTVVVSENQQGDSIVIQVRPLPHNITFDDYPDSELQALIRDAFNGVKLNFTDAIMQNSGITYISNRKAIWMLYNYSIKQAFATTKLTTMYYQVMYDGRLFGILCSSPSGRYNQESNTFLNSVRTFLFENPSWYGK